MIQQAGFQFNQALMKSNEALMKSDGEAWPKSCEAVEEARDQPRIIVEKDTALIFNLMTVQTNPQLKLLFGNLDIGEFEMNGVKLTYQYNSFIVRDNLFKFSDGFRNVLTNPNVTHVDIGEDENKIKRFLFDIGYDIEKVDE